MTSRRGGITEKVTDDNLLYNQLVLWNKQLLVVGTDLNGLPEQIDMFDASTLERVASIRLESDFHSLISVKGWPWTRCLNESATPVRLEIA